MRNNGKGPGDQGNGNHGKPQLFRALDSNNVEQNTLLGQLSSASPVSRTHQLSRLSAQFTDIVLALFILISQLPLTR